MNAGTVRKRLALVLISGLLSALTAGCLQSTLTEGNASASVPGTWIAGVTATAPSDEGFPAARIVNGQGMSGKAGRTHTHGNAEKTMWRFTADSGAAEPLRIDFDLGHILSLGDMFVWNYNAKDAKTGKALRAAGLKEIRIYTSIDKVQWNEWKGEGYPYRLAPADGTHALQATNLDDGEHSPIAFDGIAARYVRIEADTASGNGNWSSLATEENEKNVFGLSEVRFYRYDLHVEQGGMIVPLSASVDSDSGRMAELPPAADPHNTINNSGMSAYGGKNDKHNHDRDAMWLVATDSIKPVSLTVDLGGTYPLKEMHVWNYNEKDKETSGIRRFRLFVSLDGLQWQEIKGNGYPYELAMADGSERLSATNLNDGKHTPIELDNVTARFVKIVPSTEKEIRNWGAPDGSYGLSELRFYAGSGFAAEPAEEWEALFSGYNGWSGADGIFSIPLNGMDAPGTAHETKTLFLFSDTFVGTVEPSTHQRTQTSMLHNSIALLEGGEPDTTKRKFIYLPNSTDVHLFTPKTPNSPPGSWYWLQDGAVIGDHVYIFPLVVVNAHGAPGFNFATYGVNLIKMPIIDGVPDPDRQEQFDTPLYAKLPDGTGAIVFGAGVMDHTERSGAPNPDGYIYIYGYKEYDGGNKQLLAARVKPEYIEQFDQWRYWDGEDWSADILKAAVLIQGVSPELSVTPMTTGSLAGKYLLVVERDVLSGYVAISAGDSPTGPFSPLERIYYTPEIDRATQTFSYNAKAHPHLSQPGELLISYNVNSMDVMGNDMNGDLYRPRWIRLRELGK